MTVIRVRDGHRQVFPLAKGSWELVPALATDRHVVVWEYVEGTLFAILDLREGWVGYLRWDPRP